MPNPISEQARAAALAQLDAAEAAREDILVQHIANGVVINSRTVQIDPEVVIAPGAVILAGTILRGKTVIGAGCVIGPNTLIEDIYTPAHQIDELSSNSQPQSKPLDSLCRRKPCKSLKYMFQIISGYSPSRIANRKNKISDTHKHMNRYRTPGCKLQSIGQQIIDNLLNP